MCGRLSQYRGIHDFVAALAMPNALVNSVGDEPLRYYNVAPTTAVALIHLEGETLHADRVRWGWRPHWSTDRSLPINARVEKVAHGPFFRAIWPHRAIAAVDNSTTQTNAASRLNCAALATCAPNHADSGLAIAWLSLDLGRRWSGV